MPGPKVWLDYDRAQLDAQYEQRSLVPDADAYRDHDGVESEKVRASRDCRVDVAYGDGPDERLDIFPAENPRSPVLVFFHGGAWTRGTKSNESFIAPPLIAKGAAVVFPEFSLAPPARLHQIVDQCRRALKWVYAHAAELNGDAGRIVIAGHSSGAHLSAMLLTTDWPKATGLPADVIKGLVITSGIYELTPVKLSHRNGYLFLDNGAVERFSPIRRLRPDLPPVDIFYGGGELAEFRRQGRDFTDALMDRGLEVRSVDLPGLNHFEMGRELSKPDSPVHRAALRHLGLVH